jgi:hypothetical protein
MKTKMMFAALAAILASSAWAVQGSITANDSEKKGDIRYRARDKMYLVTVQRKGGSPIEIELKADDVTDISVPKPKDYDKAVEMVQKGQGIAAIGILQKIVTDYKKLNWDLPAGRYLVEAYLQANNPQKAYEAAQGIIRDDKKAAWQGDLAPAYWQSLLKLGKQQQLEALISKAASSGDRHASAAALVLRGDMIIADGGDGRDNLRKALVDGYLRAALMYGEDECKEVRSEAMLKAAKCFDSLGWAERAENLRSQARMQ